MKCSEFEILISDYLDTTITPIEKMKFEEHLRSCKSCANEFSETVVLLEKVSALPSGISPKNDLWVQIEARIVPGKPVDPPSESDSKGKVHNLNKIDEGLKYRELKNLRIYKYALVTAIAAILLIVFLPPLLKNKDVIKNIQNSVGPSWKVTKTMGITLISSNILESNGYLKEGEELETKDSSGAVIDVENLGTITLEPNTKIKFIKGDSSEKRISVIYGSIHANINAQPRTFYVDTKSATAIDLGCTYSLSVDTSGDAILYVRKGNVILTSNGRESLVPAGEYCMSKSGIGPGTPYRGNATREFKDALLSYDFGNGGSKAVDVLVKHARKTDAVTLINMLPRIEGASKSKVYERLRIIAPPPADIADYYSNYDSIPYINMKELHQWIQKLQQEIHDEVQEKMEELQKELKEKLPAEIQKNFGKEYYSPELEDEIMDKVEKSLEGLQNMKGLDKLNKLQNLQGFDYMDTMANYKYFDDEKFNKQMEKLNEELEKNNEKLDEQMEKLHEKLGKMNRDFQFNWQYNQDEMNDKMRDKEEKIREKEQERREKIREKEQEKREQEQEMKDDENPGNKPDIHEENEDKKNDDDGLNFHYKIKINIG